MDDSYSSMQGKLWLMFKECVEQIRSGKKVILFARDYVMISRNVYDKIIEEQYPTQSETRYDEPVMNNWLKERFLKPSDK